MVWNALPRVHQRATVMPGAAKKEPHVQVNMIYAHAPAILHSHPLEPCTLPCPHLHDVKETDSVDIQPTVQPVNMLIAEPSAEQLDTRQAKLSEAFEYPVLWFVWKCHLRSGKWADTGEICLPRNMTQTKQELKSNGLRFKHEHFQ